MRLAQLLPTVYKGESRIRDKIIWKDICALPILFLVIVHEVYFIFSYLFKISTFHFQTTENFLYEWSSNFDLQMSFSFFLVVNFFSPQLMCDEVLFTSKPPACHAIIIFQHLLAQQVSTYSWAMWISTPELLSSTTEINRQNCKMVELNNTLYRVGFPECEEGSKW